MLVEFDLYQDEKNRKKHWFQDEYFDLFVWFDINNGEMTNFQLCYDRLQKERVISWDYDKGFTHYYVDDGEASPHKNMSPVFIPEGQFAYTEAMPKFLESSRKIDQQISDLIVNKINEYIHSL